MDRIINNSAKSTMDQTNLFPVRDCIHRIIAETARKHPSETAIRAWDGTMTYEELGRCSTMVARLLAARGVGPEDFVALAFEKSMWTVVAMLGVLKAGGAFVPLDPTQPKSRLRNMLADVGAELVLASSEHAASAALEGYSVVKLDQDTLGRLAPEVDFVPDRAEPSNAAYAMFTSGTTGRPKAFVMEHQAYCSSAMARKDIILRSRTSRVLQFAANTFDPSIEDILTTLMVGGCICVPSEHDRLDDLSVFMRRAKVNFANLTPGFASLLTPDMVPDLEVLLLSGEAMTEEHVRTWAGRVRLMNGYGPSECAIKCAVNANVRPGSDPTNIGTPVGCALWLVDADDTDTPVANGTVGELLIQSPSVARGYLSSPRHGSSAFIETPAWLARLRTGGSLWRVYKTGDLAIRNDDGSFRFVGRKDTQVKVNGQRVELGEIEHALHASCLADVQFGTQLRVEHVAQGADKPGTLTVFVKDAAHSGDSAAEAEFHRRAARAKAQLREMLPEYMIPSTFIPVEAIPLTVNGKTDRAQLRALAARWDAAVSAEVPSVVTGGPETAQWTETQRQLGDLWASVLAVPATIIGPESRFFQFRGADSFAAIRLGAACRAAGFSLSVQDIFANPSLSAMALAMSSAAPLAAAAPIVPFALLSSKARRDHLRGAAIAQCGISEASIEDMYPTTTLQSELMAFSVKQPGAFEAQYYYDIPASVHLAAFQGAWEAVAAANAMLRTSIIYTAADGFFQVVSNAGIAWSRQETSLAEALAADRSSSFGLGRPLTRYTLVIEPGDGARYFVWSVHHAAYDRWSLIRLCELVEAAYLGGEPITPVNFNQFVQVTPRHADESRAYWKQELRGVPGTTLFPSKSSLARNVPDAALKRSISFGRKPGSDLATTTLIRSAWALVLSQYEGSPDVVFGVLVSGRAAPIQGIADILGPTISTVPFRVNLRGARTVKDLLRRVQESSLAMVPFEQVAISEIKKLGHDAELACGFRNLLIVQAPGPAPSQKDFSLALQRVGDGQDDLLSYPLTLECTPYEEGMSVQVAFNTADIDAAAIVRLLDQFDVALKQLSEEHDTRPLSEVQLVTPSDLADIEMWSGLLPPPTTACLPDLIRQQAVAQPEREAIVSWDGNLTYAELDRLSSSLAEDLVVRGVQPGDIVPFCFEKSLWAVVAMLAISKAGAAAVAIDPAHGPARREFILRKTCATLALVSLECRKQKLLDGLVKIVVVSRETVQATLVSRSEDIALARANLQSTDPAFIVFTSGSTGTPKGIVLSQKALCTSALAHGKAMQLSTESRVFQFSSFVFDVSIGDIFTTLVFGGCICMPSDSERLNNLGAAMRTLRVNQAYLTSTVAGLLQPDEVPSLRILSVGGEMVKEDILQTWADHVTLINMYGPAETSIWCAGKVGVERGDRPDDIGRPLGCRMFIADLRDHDKLAPVGVVGEILIEGDILATAYLHDEEKTAAAFITDPTWAGRSGGMAPRRFYKTGDVAKYGTDGSFHILGRRDTQLKLRGQRIELGEVEQRVREQLPAGWQVAVEAITLRGRGSAVTLVAFLADSQSEDGSQKAHHASFTSSAAGMERAMTAMQAGLAKSLPSYMVPWFFVPIGRIPLSSSGKTDRRALQDLVSGMTPQQLEAVSTTLSSGRAPSTPEETRMLALWARALNASPTSLFADSHFLRVGGDSIMAMRLVSMALSQGLSLTVTDIFRFPVLADMAVVAAPKDNTEGPSIAPFDLLEGLGDASDLCKEAASQCKVAVESVTDLYPSSPLQEGLFALSLKHPGMCISQFAYKLPPSLDKECFVSAWNTTIDQTPILRTRMVAAGPTRFIQAVVRDSVRCAVVKASLEQYLREDREATLGFGHALMRIVIIQCVETKSSYLVWTAHHAAYDAVTLRQILLRVQDTYQGKAVPASAPYRNFIKYVVTSQPEGTLDFWQSRLADAPAPSFPALPNPSYTGITTESVEASIRVPRTQVSTIITQATLVRAAWALLLSQYENSEDVVFGTISNGRNAPVANIENILGPTLATVPVRIDTRREQTIFEYLVKVQQDAIATITQEQAGLQSLARMSPQAKESCSFRNILVIQAEKGFDAAASDGGLGLQKIRTGIDDLLSYPLGLECTLGAQHIKMQVSYDPAVLGEIEASRIPRQLEHILCQLYAGLNTECGKTIAKMSLAGPHDLAQLAAWHPAPPVAVDSLLQHRFESLAASQPSCRALCSSAANMTYQELNDRSSRLAAILRTKGVEPDVVVPVCLEKSVWAVVAMLAVLKAGGAFVPLDAAQPPSRIREIVTLTGAALVLVSAQTSSTFEHRGVATLEVGPACCMDDGVRPLRHSPRGLQPANLAYLIFTSGSSGRPKGVMINHRAICSSIQAAAPKLRVTDRSRMLQYASFAFDVSIAEIFILLSCGGCVCIPSDSERRNDVVRAMNEMKVTLVCLPPSMVQSIQLDCVPTLKTLIVGGEKITRDVIDTWSGKLQLINGYGVTEAAVLSVAYHVDSTDHCVDNIGNAIGSTPWIVDPKDPARLLPIGAVGELLLQGPVVSDGYLGDPQKSSAAFFMPSQLKGLPLVDEESRIYRTGDLARFGPDGMIQYVARKDNQVKLRGNRIELGEIESRIRVEAIPGLTKVAVEVIRHKDRADSQAIAAYLCFKETHSLGSDLNDIVLPVGKAIRSTLHTLKQALAAVLPSYMVPSIYIPVRSLPTSTAGKVDRRKLRSLVDNLTSGELATYSLASQHKTPVSTPMEAKLKQLWMSALKLDGEAFGTNADFFQLGGDSIVSMRLVFAAQREGIDLSVEDTFKYPVLSDMANAAMPITPEQTTQIRPFELIPEQSRGFLVEEAAIQSAITPDLIEDMYPCTPLQEGFMTLAIKEAAGYGLVQFVWQLPASLDVPAFKAAWHATIGCHPILRTRITHTLSSPEMMQVVVNSSFPTAWHEGEELLAPYLEQDLAVSMGLGEPLLRYSVIREAAASYFALTVHHSVYDGWMLDLIMLDVEKNYLGDPNKTASVPFCHFIKFLAKKDKNNSRDFWKKTLDGALPPVFPEINAMGYRPLANSELSHVVTIPADAPACQYTLSTKLRAAWAILVARYSGEGDVVFASTLNGRTAPVPGIDLMAGPTVVTVPVRIHCAKDWTVDGLLEHVHRQAIEMIPHEHYGVQNMRRLGPDHHAACDFRSLLLIQSPQEAENADQILGLRAVRDGAAVTHTYPLMLECTLGASDVQVRAVYDANIIPTMQMQRILYQYETVVACLGGSGNTRLADLDLMSRQDLEQLAVWNRDPPAPTEVCVHDLVQRRIDDQPEHPAVCSWDGELSYRELDVYSRVLSRKLTAMGLRPGTMVPLLFEKSMYTIVTMLAVLRAGGANVALEPAHPLDRLRGIVQDVGATLVISSAQNYDKAAKLSDRVLVVKEEMLRTLAKEASLTETAAPVHVTPYSPAFILFTSGSTGKPKGIVITHTAFSSSINGHTEILCYRRGGRNFQYTAYTSDVSIGEIFTSLSVGACVCVPSDFERMNNIPGAIERMRVDWAFFTPSVASLLVPNEVPSLKFMLYGGETASPQNISIWADKLYLINSFGPAETSIWSHCNPAAKVDDLGSNIGYAIGCLTHITDPDDYNKLVPIGVLGELLVEGPNIAQGYLNNPEKTASAFVENPAWMPKDGHRRRLYRTGDMVRYFADGRVQFLGRRDTQVKLRGQRIELGEIEYQLRKAVPNVREFAVEMVRLSGPDAPKTLAAFMSMDVPAEAVGIAVSTEARLRFEDLVRGLERRLAVALPHHMIPSLYVPLTQMPMTPSAKIDRKRLQQIASEIPLEDAEQFTGRVRDKVLVSTDKERELQALWAQTLQLSQDIITADADFLHLGGDSVAAMRLVSFARNIGLFLSVKQIFAQPVLAAMALAVEDSSKVDDDVKGVDPFALIPGSLAPQLVKDAAGQCRIDSSLIEDLYPCTPLQDGIIALTTKEKGTYVSQFVFRLPANLDLDRFRCVWVSVANQAAVLRTRIISSAWFPRLLQVVISGAIEFRESDSLRAYIESDQSEGMGLASPLSRYCVVNDPEEGLHFVFTAHHAIYDHEMLLLLRSMVQDEFNGEPRTPRASFNGFIRYLQERDSSASKVFWRNQLKNAPVETFPETPKNNVGVNQVVHEHTLSLKECNNTRVTLPTIIRSAWVLTLGRYLDSTDVVFGTTNSGRGINFQGVESMIGPTISTVPVRVTFDKLQDIDSFMSGIQTQYAAMMDHEHIGLQNIKRVSEDAAIACRFNNMLFIQSQLDGDSPTDLLEFLPDVGTPTSFNAFPFMIECNMQPDRIGMRMKYNSAVLVAKEVEKLVALFGHLIQQLAALPQTGRKINELSLISAEAIAEITANSPFPPPSSLVCLHRLVENQMALRPAAEAITSTEFSLTYAEVDRYSAALATQLIRQGVGPEVLVPVCYEKSPWATVAQLGILRAGGAMVPMDPAHPPSRRLDIIMRTSPVVIVASPDTIHLFERVDVPLLEVSLFSLEEWAETGPRYEPTDVKPEHAAYVIFTSGSTGRPKGVVVEHRQVCSSIIAGVTVFRITSDTRMFNFSSYTFDASIVENYSTLVNGGCVCVPSEYERKNNFSGAASKMRVNTAFFTPSAVKTILPKALPTLRTLIVGGEVNRRDVIDTWATTVNLITGYGPTETCVFCTAHPVHELSKPSNIGRPIGCATWIVDQDDHSILVPDGTIGELLIQGPGVARGYLNDKEKTDEVFVADPDFIPEASRGQYMFYKSGDLCRKAPDGNIEFLRRKDFQVKYHGNRVELGEIEYQLQNGMRSLLSCCVEIAEPEARQKRQAIVAFLQVPSDEDKDNYESLNELAVDMTDKLREQLLDLRTYVQKMLPAYMVPSLYVPMSKLPQNVSQKMERKVIQRWLEKQPSDLLELWSLGSGKVKTMPTEDKDVRMQALWVEVLGAMPEDVGVDDNFFAVGGDSIGAMTLTSLTQRAGLYLPVEVILKTPILSEMASAAVPLEEDDVEVAPFELVEEKHNLDHLLDEAAEKCDMARENIEDIFPCMAHQERSMKDNVELPGSQTVQHTFIVPQGLAVDRFRKAWEVTVTSLSILRTRIIRLDSGDMVQVVSKEPLQWTEASNLDTFLIEDAKQHMRFGSLLSRMAIVTEAATKRTYFVWTIQHGEYDGWSNQLAAETLGRFVRSQASEPSAEKASLNQLVRYSMGLDRDSFREYWRERFAGLRLKPLADKIKDSRADTLIEQKMRIPNMARPGATAATLIEAAWALVIARHSGSPDVVFNVSLLGRSAPIPFMESLVAPALTNVPFRVAIDGSEPIEQFIAKVQDDIRGMVPYEHTGLPYIQGVSDDAAVACGSAIPLVIHPANPFRASMSSRIGMEHIATSLLASKPVVFTLDCSVTEYGMDLYVGFDSRAIRPGAAQKMVRELQYILPQICKADPTKRLDQLDWDFPEPTTPLSLHRIAEGLTFMVDDRAVPELDKGARERVYVNGLSTY